MSAVVILPALSCCSHRTIHLIKFNTRSRFESANLSIIPNQVKDVHNIISKNLPTISALVEIIIYLSPLGAMTIVKKNCSWVIKDA